MPSGSTATKTPRKSSRKKKTPATPRNLGLVKIIEEHLEGISLPAAIPRDHTKALETLGSFLVGLDKQFRVGQIDIFERGKATLSYFQGAVLTMAFNICAKRKELSFGQWLSKYCDFSQETARIVRLIYARFKLREVQALGYWNAYLTIKEEKALAADAKKKDGKKSGGKGGGGDKPPKPLTLTLGTHVAKIKKHAEDLLTESEAAPPELFASPEREGVDFRSFADDMRAAMKDLARSILVLYKLASSPNCA